MRWLQVGIAQVRVRATELRERRAVEARDTVRDAVGRVGDAIGLVIYEIKGDGTLEGLWTVAGEDGVGTEKLIPE